MEVLFMSKKNKENKNNRNNENNQIGIFYGFFHAVRKADIVVDFKIRDVGMAAHGFKHV